jgi:microbial collagenase
VFLQPTASFANSPAAPVHGTAVSFTSTVHDSDDTSFTYRWLFPNGSVSTLANPTYTFGTAGTKTVTLTVFDAHGDQVRVARSITVT